MGNKESSEESAVEETPSNEKEKAAQSRNQVAQLGELEFAQLTYKDIYLEESQESGDGLDDYTEVDSEDDSSTCLRNYPDSTSVVSRVRAFSAWLSFVIGYNKSASELSIRLKGTTNVPGRGQGGANAYQVLLTLMPAGKQTVTSKIRVGPNPTFNDSWTFHIPIAKLPQSSIRCRLYGCTNGEKDRALCEGFISLAEINTRVESPISIQVHPISESSIMADTISQKEEEDVSDEHELSAQNFVTVQSQSMPNLTASSFPQPLASELLLNAAYNPVTGRMECSIQQAHGIRLPGTKSSKPYSFVRLQLRNDDNKVLAHSKTKICKKLNNPAFNETFFFNVTGFEVDRITLVVIMFHKRPPNKKVYLGGFSLGLVNTSKTEKEHWDEILQSGGQRVARWHKLYTNVI